MYCGRPKSLTSTSSKSVNYLLIVGFQSPQDLLLKKARVRFALDLTCGFPKKEIHACFRRLSRLSRFMRSFRADTTSFGRGKKRGSLGPLIYLSDPRLCLLPLLAKHCRALIAHIRRIRATDSFSPSAFLCSLFTGQSQLLADQSGMNRFTRAFARASSSPFIQQPLSLPRKFRFRPLLWRSSSKETKDASYFRMIMTTLLQKELLEIRRISERN